jgi:uncharacterized membrane protein
MTRSYPVISSRRSAVYIALLASSLLCAAMVFARVWHTASLGFAFLLWNLFLAWIPLVSAAALYDRNRRGTATWKLLCLGAFWLLFYPNAPYILTDLIHLVEHPAGLVWFDLLLIASTAWTGLLLGFVSLAMVQSVIRSRVGSLSSWAFVALVSGLGAFGICLGRFERWNSWDVVTRPHTLFSDVLDKLVDPFAHAQTVAVTLVLGAFLMVSYLGVAALMSVGNASRGSDSHF